MRALLWPGPPVTLIICPIVGLVLISPPSTCLVLGLTSRHSNRQAFSLSLTFPIFPTRRNVAPLLASPLFV